jgi:hypothetical protein
MSSSKITDYIGSGLAASRPATPSLATGATGIYYATDTGALTVWDGSAWQTISAGASSARRLFSAYTAVGTTTSTSETDLQTYTLPANTVSSDGQRLRIKAGGTMAATTRSRTPRIYFGAASTGIGTSLSTDTYWLFEYDILRAGSASQIIDIKGLIGANNGAPAQTYERNVATSVDLTSSQVIKATGLVGGTPVANDIVCNFLTVELLP